MIALTIILIVHGEPLVVDPGVYRVSVTLRGIRTFQSKLNFERIENVLNLDVSDR